MGRPPSSGLPEVQGQELADAESGPGPGRAGCAHGSPSVPTPPSASPTWWRSTVRSSRRVYSTLTPADVLGGSATAHTVGVGDTELDTAWRQRVVGGTPAWPPRTQ
jgi:hypothetical protein